MADRANPFPGIVVELPGQQSSTAGLVPPAPRPALPPVDIGDDEALERDAYRREQRGDFVGYYLTDEYHNLYNRRESLRYFPDTPDKITEIMRINTRLNEIKRLGDAQKARQQRGVQRPPSGPGPVVPMHVGAEDGGSAGRFASPPMATADASRSTQALGGMPPLGLIDPQHVYEKFARPAARGFLHGSASMLDAAAVPYEWAFGPLPKGASKWLRSIAPDLPEPQGLREEFTRTFAEAVGGLPPGIVVWMGGVPFAGLHGWTIAEEMAKQQGRAATVGEKIRGAAIEAVARKFLGWAVQKDWGALTTGFVFGGTAGATSYAHGMEPRQAGISAVTNFLLGVLGRRISPREMAQVRAAEEAAARGEGAGALRHLDPILRQHADAIAKAAYDERIILEPTAGGQGRDVGPVRPTPRPRTPRLGPADRQFDTSAGQTYRVGPDGIAILARGETVQATPARPERTVYMVEELAHRLMNTLNKWTAGPVMITVPPFERGIMPRLRVYGYDQNRNVWRHIPEAGLPVRSEPEAGSLPLQMWNGGRGYAFASKILRVREPGEAPPEPTGWRGAPRAPGEPVRMHGRTEPETIRAAAVRVDGKVYEAANHVDAVKKASQELGRHEDDIWRQIALQDRDAKVESDGFVTSSGRYVTREQAMRIAKSQGQVKDETLADKARKDPERVSQEDQLASEDLKPQPTVGAREFTVRLEEGTFTGKTQVEAVQKASIGTGYTEADIWRMIGERGGAGASGSYGFDPGGAAATPRTPAVQRGPPPIPPKPPAIVPPGGGFTMPPGAPPPLPPRAHDLPPVLSTQWRLATERGSAVLGATITQRERADVLIRKATDAMEKAFHGVRDNARIAMVTAWMKGMREHIPKQFREQFKKADELFRQAELAEHMTGAIHYEVRTNYFPLFWHPKDRTAAATYGQGSAPYGPKFWRSKVFSDMQEGIDAGFTPVTTNPGAFAAMRLEAGHRAMERVLAMQRLQRDGLAITEVEFNKMFPRVRGRAGMEAARPTGPYTGWQVMRVGGRDWLAHPKVKKLLEWGLHIDQQSLAQRMGLQPHGTTQNVMDSIGTVWQNTRNLVIPLKLSLSAFHAMHMLNIRLANPWGVVLESLFKRDLPLKDLYRQIRDISATGSQAYGKRTGELFNKPESEMTPGEIIDKNLMIAGGFNPHQPSIYQLHAERHLSRLLGDEIPTLLQSPPRGVIEMFAKQWNMSVAGAKVAFNTLARGVEAMQHPLFGVWIPSIKTAAYLNQAKVLVARRPDLVTGSPKANAELRHELRQIAKSIDNRFGMMQYDKVFGPLLTKRFFMATMLSVGWNYGFFREFMAGPGRDIAKGARARTSEVTSTNLRREAGESSQEAAVGTRSAYAATYTMFSLLTAAMLTYLFTGKPPDEPKDYIYPQMPDGSRINTQMFTREFGAMYYHLRNEGAGPGLLELLVNKANSLVTAIWDILRGHDYYGRQTYNPHAPFWEQALQIGWHVAVASSMPISVQSVHSGQVTDPQQIALSLAGYNPAPRYVEKSGIVASIQHAYNVQHPQQVIPWGEIERADAVRGVRRSFNEFKRTGDQRHLTAFVQGLATYIQKNPDRAQVAEQMVRSWLLPEAAIQFRGLDPATQLAILRKATPEERAMYLPFINRRRPTAIQGLGTLQ